MKTVFQVLGFFAALIIIALLDKPTKQVEPAMRATLKRAEQASLALNKPEFSNKAQRGEMVFESDGSRITQRQVNNYLYGKYSEKERAHYFIWNDQQGGAGAMSAPGMDRLHHFANSYLVGIRPFAVQNKWLPLYVLSQRKSYQLDSEQYGELERWQNSAEAFRYLRGDCEDHAIALADWLISEGIDARVAVGTYEGGGHAWVIAYLEGKAFLLEATDKRARKSWNHYPLAASALGYRAKFMFNREHMWHHTANEKGTRDYSSSSWQRVSRFLRKS